MQGDSLITIDDFSKVELKVARVLDASEVEGSEKLLKLKVSLGEPSSAETMAGEEDRQILAGIKNSYSPADLIGKQIVVVANLQSRKMMGMESQGMVLAARDEEGNVVLIAPFQDVPNGSKIG